MAAEIVCIGQAIIDCITRGKEEKPHKKNVYRAENISLNTGEKGCTVSGEQGQFSMPAYAVNAVDSTGGGDNFVAGFISALLHGGSLRECCQYGTACAAVCVQSIGATTGVKSRESVEEFLKEIRS